MAKKRRASLKDKDPETLGVTQKKSKGIDLLFGEADQDTAMESRMSNESTSASTSFADNDLSGIMNFNERAVDELGLPVALEAPPDDLILASTPAGPTLDEAEADLVNPSTSPFAMPALDNVEAGIRDDATDLSGILAEENLPAGEETKVSTSEKENDLSGIVEEGTAPAATPPSTIDGAAVPSATDLSGLVTEAESTPSGVAPTDLSGLVTGEDDLSGLASEADLTSPPVTPPPTTAAPINMQPPFSQPTYTTTPPYASTMPQPPLVTNVPPPSTATGAPNLSPPRPATIELEGFHQNVVSTLSGLGSAIPGTREAFLPKDELPTDQGTLVVTQSGQATTDPAVIERVLRYIGPDRRNQLFEEILSLHNEVAREFKNNKTDVNFALETLREANNYIIETPHEYDEALYRVTLVKTMLARKHSISYWSYRMGLFVLLYGILWTVICIWGVFVNIDFGALLRGDVLGEVFEAVYFSALAGGLGGSVEIFWRLYYRVSVKQDFDPQYLMYYLVKPILGFVLGMVMYFLVAVASAIGGPSTLPEAEASTGFILAILLGFIAGYRQESVFDMIYVLIKKISPESASGDTKSVVPLPDEVEVSYKAQIDKTTS
jgi:hypothetical protein